jgi:flagellar protein FliO/FliZ
MMKIILSQIICLTFTSLVWAGEETNVGSPLAITAVANVQGTEAQPILETAPVVQKTAAAKATLKEDEIPLNVDLSKKASDTASTSSRLLITFFILFAIVGTSYYLVRKYKLSNNINKSNKQIKVISQHYLGPKKSLAIIHVAGESILIGVTDSNISMIKSLSLIDDEVPTNLPQNFADSLEMKSEPAAGATAKPVQPDELEEEFSFAGVRDTVSKKIKSMRSFS